MYNWQDFDSVFHAKPDFSPDHKHAEGAAKHRKELGGKLFFDRMWTALGLEKGESRTAAYGSTLTSLQ